MAFEEFEGHFGVCSECGGTDGYVNAGRTHVFYCLAHRKSWIGGANLFSSWRDETEDEQRERYDAVTAEFERVA